MQKIENSKTIVIICSNSTSTEKAKERFHTAWELELKTTGFLNLPESYLHPKQAFDYMTETIESSFDLVVFTHSQHVLNAIRIAVCKGVLLPENVLIEFYAGDEVINLKVDKRGKIETWPKEFFDQLEDELETLLRY